MTDKPVEPMTEEAPNFGSREYGFVIERKAIAYLLRLSGADETVLASLEGSCFRVKKLIDSLKAKVEEWRGDNERLRAENERLTERLLIPCPRIHPMDDVDKRLDALAGENERIKQELSERVAQQAADSQDDEDLSQILFRLQAGNEKLQAQLTAEQAAHEKTKAECSSLDIIRLREKLRASEEAREKCQASFDRVVGEREALRHAIRIKDEVIAERGVDLLDLRGQLRTLRSDLAAKDAEIEKWHNSSDEWCRRWQAMSHEQSRQARALEAADALYASLADHHERGMDRVWSLARAYRSLRSPAPKEEQWCFGRVDGCSGKGRPTCKATECIYGAEPCGECGGFKAIGGTCAVIHGPKEETPKPETCKAAPTPRGAYLAHQNWECGLPLPCADHQEKPGAAVVDQCAIEKPKTHEFRCELDFGGKVLSGRGHHNYEAGRCFQPVEHHLCTICSKPFSDPAHS